MPNDFNEYDYLNGVPDDDEDGSGCWRLAACLATVGVLLGLAALVGAAYAVYRLLT